MKSLSILFLSFTLFSCLKGETHLLGQELKDYIAFNKGSFWIYKKNNQDLRDTLKIYQSEIKIGAALGRNLDKGEGLFLKKYSSYYKDSLFVIASGEGNQAFGTNFSDVYFISQPYVNRILFFADKAVGYRLKITDEGTYTDYVSQHPTYTVAGKEYTDVREYFSVLGFENPTAIDPRLPNRVWYARHVGIIKKQLPNGEVWELIHHEVIQ